MAKQHRYRSGAVALPSDSQDSVLCSASIQRFASLVGSSADAKVTLAALPGAETALFAAHVFAPIFAAPTAERFGYLAESIL